MNLLIFPRTGTPNALFHATYKILASRGGRNPTSTGSGFGGSINKRGLAPAPFLFFRSRLSRQLITIRDCYHGPGLIILPTVVGGIIFGADVHGPPTRAAPEGTAPRHARPGANRPASCKPHRRYPPVAAHTERLRLRAVARFLDMGGPGPTAAWEAARRFTPAGLNAGSTPDCSRWA